MQTTIEKVSIEEVKKTINEHFPDYWNATEVCLATVATLLLKENSNPTALVLIGEPSKGKTTVLDFFVGIEGISYLSDQFTPKAFVSHYANKDKKQLSNTDLLDRVTQKCLIVPDFGVIFGKRKEDLAESLSLLTRVLDGSGLSTDSGVHGQRAVKGDRMLCMLCATTPFGYDVWDAMGRFGSRLLFLQMPDSDKNVQKFIDEIKTGIHYGEKKSKCAEAITNFIKELWAEKGGFRSVSWNRETLPNDVLEAIFTFAQLLSTLRGMIHKLYEDEGNFEYQKPTIEDPRRAFALLSNLAKGRAIINGRDQIDSSDIPMLFNVVLGSCPEERGKIIRELLKRNAEPLSTAEVCKLLGVSTKTAIRAMENLKILGLCEIFYDDSGKEGRPSKMINLSLDAVELLKLNAIKEYFSKIDADTNAPSLASNSSC